MQQQGLLGKRLRLIRAQRKLSLRQAAKLAGLAKETLGDLERGKRHPTDITLAKLAEIYEIELQELFDLEEEASLAEAEASETEEPVLTGKAEAPGEEAGLTDEEITRILTGPVTTGEAISEADMKKLLQYDIGNIVISALEQLCDLAEHGLNSNRFKLDYLEILEEHVSGQYYSHKYDPRREDIFWRGTPQQKVALEREETRIDEVLAALQRAYFECLETEQLPEDEVYAKRQAREAAQKKHAERPGSRLISGIGA